MKPEARRLVRALIQSLEHKEELFFAARPFLDDPDGERRIDDTTDDQIEAKIVSKELAKKVQEALRKHD